MCFISNWVKINHFLCKLNIFIQDNDDYSEIFFNIV